MSRYTAVPGDNSMDIFEHLVRHPMWELTMDGQTYGTSHHGIRNVLMIFRKRKRPSDEQILILEKKLGDQIDKTRMTVAFRGNNCLKKQLACS